MKITLPIIALAGATLCLPLIANAAEGGLGKKEDDEYLFLSVSSLTVASLSEACAFDVQENIDNPNISETAFAVLAANRKACDFYITGCSHVLFSLPEVRERFNYCPPPDITLGEQTKLFVNWANNHKDRGNDKAIVGVLESLSTAHPCKKKQ